MDSIRRDHKEISTILDKALLSEAPVDSFRAALARVQAYSTVDSAWISGLSFFVKYKHGGIVSWTVPTEPTNQPTQQGEKRK
jgi:hypothetical protein